MTDLVEGNAWVAGIYQLETDDPVMGGAEGIDNLQAKQLASRTQYLLAQLLLRAPLDSPTFTGDPKAPTPAAADNDTSIATTAFVKTAIANLVASSPAALDTLNELAAALGNDANFSATVTNALALKAPLASPIFTGDPKAPTPAPGDNDTSIATTAFVQDAISQILSGADIAARFTTTANINLNGLAVQAGGDWGAALTAGDIILVKDQAVPQNNGWYVSAAGAWTRVNYLDQSSEIKAGMLTKVTEGATLADTVWMLTTDAPIVLNTSALNFSRKDGNQLIKATAAELLAGTDDNKFATAAGLLAGLLGAGGTSANDYVILPFRDKTTGVRRNLIIQTGENTISTVDTAQTVTFPIAFPTRCSVVIATPVSAFNSTSWPSVNVNSKTTNSFQLVNDGGTAILTANWIAVGF